MQLLLLLAIIATITVAEQMPHVAIDHAAWRLIAAIGLACLAPLAAWGISLSAARRIDRHPLDAEAALARFGRLRKLQMLVWLAAAGLTLWPVGWIQLVRFNAGLQAWPLLDEVLILLPLLLPLALSWVAFYAVESSLQHLGASSEASTTPAAKRWQYVSLHLRHHLGVMLIPVLVVLGVQDVVRLYADQLSDETTALIMLVPLIGLMMMFPLALAHIWQTVPLPGGPLRDELKQFCATRGFRPNQFLVWQTSGLVINAAVAGFTPPWRYVFFTDKLLASFGRGDLLAVLGHELGHVRRRHLPARLALVVLPVVAWLVIAKWAPDRVQAASAQLAAWGWAENLQAPLLFPLMLALFAATVFAWHSHLLEHDADLFAARSLSDNGSLSPEATMQVATMLDQLAVVGGIGHHARSWLHPTLARRIYVLLWSGHFPDRAARLENRLRWLNRSLWLGIAAALVALAWPA